MVQSDKANLVGQTIGNYRIVRQIGEGGMGVVYLAEHPVIGRKVAIKLLHITFARDPDIVARFFNEARAIHLVTHPNIVEILDFGQTGDGQPYFVMEYLEGEPLADRIARGPVPIEEAVEITAQICSAVQAAHDKSIIHRDLKPHNVYLMSGSGQKPEIKILDFGVAKMMTGWEAGQSGGQSVKTRTGSLMGTPLYMSPEQCRGSGTLDHRTDIYSLAVIAFEMIAGRPPFIAEGVGELFAKHMLEPAPSLAELVPNAPDRVVRSIARALAKSIDDRFSSMRDFRDALIGARDVISSPGTQPRAATSARVPTSPTQIARSVPAEQSTTLSSAVAAIEDELGIGSRRRRKRGVFFAAVGLLAAGAVALGVIGARRAEQAEGGREDSAGGRSAAAASAAAETVTITFEAEPAGTRVKDQRDGRDLGPVPVEVKLPRSEQSSVFVLSAAGHAEYPIAVEHDRDRVVHVVLSKNDDDADRSDDKREAATAKSADKSADKSAEKSASSKRAPRSKPRRPIVNDGDGLAVPSF